MSERKFLTKQISNTLAERNGWSTTYTEGYLEGRHHQRTGKPLGAYASVGIDAYSSGYRAGYFQRKNPNFAQGQTLSTPKMKPKLLLE